ncbi:MAG TPA: response regulator [Tepidisphaeraceae bacterium]|nr:response regulator [Tepidisphaeraceae bacterium]
MAYTILIVDDSATTRAVIKRTIQMAQVPVTRFIEAGNGKDALTILRQGGVDLVLLDLNMPEMTGMEVAAEANVDPDIAAPIVIVSSESMASRIAQLKAQGVRDYIKKPFTPEQIRDVVTNVLGAAHV